MSMKDYESKLKPRDAGLPKEARLPEEKHDPFPRDVAEYELILDMLDRGENIGVVKLCMERNDWGLAQGHAWLTGFLASHYNPIWKEENKKT
jgi:hypothetical protein